MWSKSGVWDHKKFDSKNFSTVLTSKSQIIYITLVLGTENRGIFKFVWKLYLDQGVIRICFINCVISITISWALHSKIQFMSQSWKGIKFLQT